MSIAGEEVVWKSDNEKIAITKYFLDASETYSVYRKTELYVRGEWGEWWKHMCIFETLQAAICFAEKILINGGAGISQKAERR